MFFSKVLYMTRLLFFLFFSFCLLSVEAQEIYDKPRNGEGISTFLERNNRPGRAYYREFLELNKQRLRGKEELRLGVKYQLPPLRDGKQSNSRTKGSKPRKIHEHLFGRKLDDVQVTGSRLKGACFYVVSGHGGPDPGAIGYMNGKELHEDPEVPNFGNAGRGPRLVPGMCIAVEPMVCQYKYAVKTLKDGWTVKTAVCMAVFSLFHWPCATTCLTIKKETGSLKWTAVSILLPAAAGCILCMMICVGWPLFFH